MSEKTREIEKGGAEDEITVSAEAAVIAEAIGYCGDGFHAIARAIEKLAVLMNGDEGEVEESEFYMDGKPK